MEAGGTSHCNAWHIDFNKDTLHSKKMYWNRAINPRSKATWGCFGEDSQKLFLISVMASGSYSQHLILMDAAALYKDRHHTVVCPYYIYIFFSNNNNNNNNNNNIVYWFLFMLKVVIIPLMKMKNTSKIPLLQCTSPYLW